MQEQNKPEQSFLSPKPFKFKISFVIIFMGIMILFGLDLIYGAIKIRNAKLPEPSIIEVFLDNDLKFREVNDKSLYFDTKPEIMNSHKLIFLRSDTAEGKTTNYFCDVYAYTNKLVTRIVKMNADKTMQYTNPQEKLMPDIWPAIKKHYFGIKEATLKEATQEKAVLTVSPKKNPFKAALILGVIIVLPGIIIIGADIKMQKTEWLMKEVFMKEMGKVMSQKDKQ